MTPEQLLQHRELEFLRACGSRDKARILRRAEKLRQARLLAARLNRRMA